MKKVFTRCIVCSVLLCAVAWSEEMTGDTVQSGMAETATTTAVSKADEPAIGFLRSVLKAPDAFQTHLEIAGQYMAGSADILDMMSNVDLSFTGPTHELFSLNEFRYGKINGQTYTQKFATAQRWIVHMSSRWLLMSQADYTFDKIQLIRNSFNFTAVIASFIVKNEGVKLLWGLGASPSYEQQLDHRTGEPLDYTYSTFLVSYETFKWNISPHLRLGEKCIGMLDAVDHERYKVSFETTLDRQITSNMTVGLRYLLDYSSKPAPTIPLRQQSVMASLGYSL